MYNNSYYDEFQAAPYMNDSYNPYTYDNYYNDYLPAMANDVMPMNQQQNYPFPCPMQTQWMPGMQMQGMPMTGMQTPGMQMGGMDMQGMPMTGTQYPGMQMGGVDMQGTPMTGMQAPGMQMQGTQNQTAPMAEGQQSPFEVAPGSPITLDTQYTQGYLRTLIGKRVKIDFLVGTNMLIDREGTLLTVGISYVVIREVDTNNQVMCDIYSIKFVSVYEPVTTR